MGFFWMESICLNKFTFCKPISVQTYLDNSTFIPWSKIHINYISYNTFLLCIQFSNVLSHLDHFLEPSLDEWNEVLSKNKTKSFWYELKGALSDQNVFVIKFPFLYYRPSQKFVHNSNIVGGAGGWKDRPFFYVY